MHTSVEFYPVARVGAAGVRDDAQAPQWTPEALQIFLNELRQVLTAEEAKLRSVMLCLRHMQPGPMLMNAFLSCCQVRVISAVGDCHRGQRFSLHAVETGITTGMPAAVKCGCHAVCVVLEAWSQPEQSVNNPDLVPRARPRSIASRWRRSFLPRTRSTCQYTELQLSIPNLCRWPCCPLRAVEQPNFQTCNMQSSSAGSWVQRHPRSSGA